MRILSIDFSGEWLRSLASIGLAERENGSILENTQYQLVSLRQSRDMGPLMRRK